MSAVQQWKTELVCSALEWARRRFFALQQAKGWNILAVNHCNAKNQSCALTVVLLQGLRCYCTLSQLDVGRNGEMGQEPRPQYPVSWLVLLVQVYTPTANWSPGITEQPRISLAPLYQHWDSTDGLPESRRDTHTFSSTFREGISATAHKAEQWKLWLPPSANPFVRKETEVHGSEQPVGREQLYGDKIQW